MGKHFHVHNGMLWLGSHDEARKQATGHKPLLLLFVVEYCLPRRSLTSSDICKNHQFLSLKIRKVTDTSFEVVSKPKSYYLQIHSENFLSKIHTTRKNIYTKVVQLSQNEISTLLNVCVLKYVLTNISYKMFEHSCLVILLTIEPC